MPLDWKPSNAGCSPHRVIGHFEQSGHCLLRGRLKSEFIHGGGRRKQALQSTAPSPSARLSNQSMTTPNNRPPTSPKKQKVRSAEIQRLAQRRGWRSVQRCGLRGCWTPPCRIHRVRSARLVIDSSVGKMILRRHQESVLRSKPR